MTGFANSTMDLYVVLGIVRIGFGLIATVISGSHQNIQWQRSGTSCFFSSSLSPTASLAAVARVLRVASLSLATSRAQRSIKAGVARHGWKTYACCPLLRQWIQHLGSSQRAGWRRSCESAGQQDRPIFKLKSRGSLLDRLHFDG